MSESLLPIRRFRRLRKSPAIRSMVQETRVNVQDLIQPLFVVPGANIERAIQSLPGQMQRSPDKVAQKALELWTLGIPAVLLFAIPEKK